MTRSVFIIETKTEDKELYSALEEMVVKMQKTLDVCRDVTEKRTKFVISQKRVILRKNEK